MKKALKSLLCVILSAALLLSLAGCSGGAKMTEENVNATVELAVDALKTFDTDKLEKYVDSRTLGFIIKLAKEHDQFAELGRAMFECLTIEVKAIDLEAGCAEVEVRNRNLFAIASNFTYELMRDNSTLQLVSLLNDEAFLNTSLNELTQSISNTSIGDEPQTVTLKIVQKKRNLVISVDEEAENAISGGALKAIKSIVG